MMTIYKIILAAILGFSAVSVSSQEVLMQTDSFYKRGNLFKVIESDSIQIIASLQEAKKYGHYFKIVLSIANKSNNRIEFIPNDITGEYIYYKKDTTNISVSAISYEEYARKVRNHVSVAEVFSVINASLQSLSNEPTGTISYRDNSGNKSTIDVYDKAIKDEERRRNFERVERYSQLKYEFAESERDTYLFRETLFPNDAIWGYVVVKYKPCHDLNIVLRMKENSYLFKWKLQNPEIEKMDKQKDDIYR